MELYIVMEFTQATSVTVRTAFLSFYKNNFYFSLSSEKLLLNYKNVTLIFFLLIIAFLHLMFAKTSFLDIHFSYFLKNV